MKRKAFGQQLARKRRRVTRVAKIIKTVKRTIRREAETKYTTVQGAPSLHDGQLRLINLLVGLGQGTDRNQRIGDKIHLTGLSVKLKCTNNLNDIPTSLMFAIIEHDKELGLSTIGTATDYIEDTGGDPEMWRLDKEKCAKIHRIGKIRVRPIIASTGEKNGVKNLYIKFNKTFVFNPTSGYGKNTNFYLIMWGNVAGGGVTNTMISKYYTKFYFKDI